MPEPKSSRAFNAFTGRMRGRRLGLSYVIEISYRAKNAEQAVRIVNSIASAYAAYRLRGALAREQRRGVYREGRLSALHSQMLAAEAGMRFGVIPEANMVDAEVRLLGGAALPLVSIYPKMLPILMLMALSGIVTGLLIVVMPGTVSSAGVRRPAQTGSFSERVRIA